MAGSISARLYAAVILCLCFQLKNEPNTQQALNKHLHWLHRACLDEAAAGAFPALMVNTLFSAFTWYVTSIVAPPSIGFLLLGFIFGPVMLDYAARFSDAICEEDGEDLAGPLISFLRVEGLTVTLFWCAAAVWYKLHVCRGLAFGHPSARPVCAELLPPLPRALNPSSALQAHLSIVHSIAKASRRRRLGLYARWRLRTEAWLRGGAYLRHLPGLCWDRHHGRSGWLVTHPHPALSRA